MSSSQEPDPVGYIVENFTVLGEERDGMRRWVGADLLLRIPPIGKFALNVVTKDHFGNEIMQSTFYDAENPELLLSTNQTESRKPFVLNDQVITLDILFRKFRGRCVEADLAASLWYEGELEESS